MCEYNIKASMTSTIVSQVQDLSRAIDQLGEFLPVQDVVDFDVDGALNLAHLDAAIDQVHKLSNNTLYKDNKFVFDNLFPGLNNLHEVLTMWDTVSPERIAGIIQSCKDFLRASPPVIDQYPDTDNAEMQSDKEDLVRAKNDVDASLRILRTRLQGHLSQLLATHKLTDDTSQIVGSTRDMVRSIEENSAPPPPQTNTNYRIVFVPDSASSIKYAIVEGELPDGRVHRSLRNVSIDPWQSQRVNLVDSADGVDRKSYFDIPPNSWLYVDPTNKVVKFRNLDQSNAQQFETVFTEAGVAYPSAVVSLEVFTEFELATGDGGVDPTVGGGVTEEYVIDRKAGRKWRVDSLPHNNSFTTDARTGFSYLTFVDGKTGEQVVVELVVGYPYKRVQQEGHMTGGGTHMAGGDLNDQIRGGPLVKQPSDNDEFHNADEGEPQSEEELEAKAEEIHQRLESEEKAKLDAAQEHAQQTVRLEEASAEHEEDDEKGASDAEHEEDDEEGASDAEHEEDDEEGASDAEHEEDDEKGASDAEHEEDDEEEASDAEHEEDDEEEAVTTPAKDTPIQSAEQANNKEDATSPVAQLLKQTKDRLAQLASQQLPHPTQAASSDAPAAAAVTAASKAEELKAQAKAEADAEQASERAQQLLANDPALLEGNRNRPDSDKQPSNGPTRKPFIRIDVNATGDDSDKENAEQDLKAEADEVSQRLAPLRAQANAEQASVKENADKVQKSLADDASKAKAEEDAAVKRASEHAQQLRANATGDDIDIGGGPSYPVEFHDGEITTNISDHRRILWGRYLECQPAFPTSAQPLTKSIDVSRIDIANGTLGKLKVTTSAGVDDYQMLTKAALTDTYVVALEGQRCVVGLHIPTRRDTPKLLLVPTVLMKPVNSVFTSAVGYFNRLFQNPRIASVFKAMKDPSVSLDVRTQLLELCAYVSYVQTLLSSTSIDKSVDELRKAVQVPLLDAFVRRAKRIQELESIQKELGETRSPNGAIDLNNTKRVFTELSRRGAMDLVYDLTGARPPTGDMRSLNDLGTSYAQMLSYIDDRCWTFLTQLKGYASILAKLETGTGTSDALLQVLVDTLNGISSSYDPSASRKDHIRQCKEAVEKLRVQTTTVLRQMRGESVGDAPQAAQMSCMVIARNKVPNVLKRLNAAYEDEISVQIPEFLQRLQRMVDATDQRSRTVFDEMDNSKALLAKLVEAANSQIEKSKSDRDRLEQLTDFKLRRLIKFVKTMVDQYRSFFRFHSTFIARDFRESAATLGAFMKQQELKEPLRQGRTPAQLSRREKADSERYAKVRSMMALLDDKVQDFTTKFDRKFSTMFVTSAGVREYFDDAQSKALQDELDAGQAVYHDLADKIISMYRKQSGLQDIMKDTQFTLLYFVKGVRILFFALSLFLATSIFSNHYVDVVFTQKKPPPSLVWMVLIFLAIDLGLNVLLWIILSFLQRLNAKGNDGSFALLDATFFKRMLTDYVLVSSMILVLGCVISYIIAKKVVFDYQNDGVKPIQAFKSILFAISGFLLLPPFFLIAG